MLRIDAFANESSWFNDNAGNDGSNVGWWGISCVPIVVGGAWSKFNGWIPAGKNPAGGGGSPSDIMPLGNGARAVGAKILICKLLNSTN